MNEITVAGIEIRVIKKKIKNMYLRVLPPDGSVQITAPKTAADDALYRFALSNIAWIQKQRQKFEARERKPPRRFVSGESESVWGVRYRLEVQESGGRNSVRIDGGKLLLQVRKGSTQQQREAVLKEWYRDELKRAIPPVLERCQGIVGVKAEEWRVKDMRTRWGTCNPGKKRIWLCLQLAKKAPECLEYVIIHELVHFFERGHNARFKRHMDECYPNWRAIKALLNEPLPDGK